MQDARSPCDVHDEPCRRRRLVQRWWPFPGGTRAARCRSREHDDLEPAEPGPGSSRASCTGEGAGARNAGRPRRSGAPARGRPPPGRRAPRARAAVDHRARGRRRHPARAPRRPARPARRARTEHRRHLVRGGGRTADAALPAPRRLRRAAGQPSEAARERGAAAERRALSHAAPRSAVGCRAARRVARARGARPAQRTRRLSAVAPPESSPRAAPAAPPRPQIIVVTTAMLVFISFWRAAAIVLCDMASTVYYIGGIVEQAIGKAAPWYIGAVMLFAYAVRGIYIESCAMFVRGGVYRVVKEAMGGTLAKLSVSALMFDYVLTGPISGVSAGQYIVGLISQITVYLGHPWTPSTSTVNYLAAGIAAGITIYFWWRNTRGIHESSDDALRIMYVTTAMVVLLIGWCTFTILTRPQMQRLPPAPAPHNLTFNSDAVGWMPKVLPNAFQKAEPGASPHETSEPHFSLVEHAGMLIGLIGILMAFGHSFLAMSGEESLAQVNRELEYPKHKNLMRAGLIIFLYSMLFTSLVSFFAYAIIPDDVRSQYFDNLISGIALNLSGPKTLKLAFQAFIVIVGFLMLAGAINTAIVGANGVLNRVSEDGVMTDWFRAPHQKYGTTYRMINLIVLLQLVAIVGSRGNTYTLGEAYAFGVIWSFAFKGLAVLVLRFKDKSEREWKVPFNIRLDGNELPIGLGVITMLLFSVAGVNLITKEVATISGIAFTIVFFTIFLVSERINERQRADEIHTTSAMDQFRLHASQAISNQTVEVRPGNTICLVRDYHTLGHLRKGLE